MTGEQKAVHERLVTSLPVRTHFQRPQAEVIHSGNWKALTRKQSIELHAEIQKLHKRGLNNKEIAGRLGVSPTSVGRHLRGEVRCVSGPKK